MPPLWQRLGFRSEHAYRAARRRPEYQRALRRATRRARVGATRRSILERAGEAIRRGIAVVPPWPVTQHRSRRGYEVWQAVIYITLSDGTHHPYAIEYDHFPTREEVARDVPRVYFLFYPENTELSIRSWRIEGVVHLVP